MRPPTVLRHPTPAAVRTLRGGKWLVPVAALLVVAVAASCTNAAEVPPLERRAQRLDKAIMCPVCPGESIDQSQNALAVQMRAIVREMLEDNRTEQEIKDYFVESYQATVLMEPPRDGFSLTVWIVPPVAVAGALAVLYLVLRVMRRPPAGGPPRDFPVELSADERDDYFRRIEAVLDSADGRRARPAGDARPTSGDEADG